MDSIKEKLRWNCPTDRELVLRAKLNSGWSVHSHDYFEKKEPIQDPELRSIENVIERARQIDMLEKERIGRMVFRLENMKRNTVGDGKKTCSMCGISFGVFRVSSVICCDCCMAVCEKCRVDIQNNPQEMCVLCKICAENREVWKKSGGWFYGQVPPSELQSFQNMKYIQKSGSPSCARAFDTWEHRRPDIVRLESFEPPEENHNDNPLYKNWAVSSSPDISSIDEDDSFSEEHTEKVRKNADIDVGLEMHSLSAPDENKLSVSCPCLPVLEHNPIYKQAEVPKKRLRRIFSKKKILSPAHKVMEKFTRHRKISNEMKVS
ncbi:rab effector Noc2 [Caerostris extrusa]|uniref:Rab effector Noc2 n=1 Tax=Caerostris extrusa TaxID=172846 RepID=A0AAV4Q8X1_CAEEX|nr:rab effector Noc2 [Caerostris extrusa]